MWERGWCPYIRFRGQGERGLNPKQQLDTEPTISWAVASSFPPGVKF